MDATRNIADLTRGFEGLDESRLVELADLHADHDGVISVPEIEAYVASPLNYAPWNPDDLVVGRVKKAITDGTELIDERTNIAYLTRGIWGMNASRLIRQADMNSDHDGLTSVAEIDAYLAAQSYPKPWTRPETVARVKSAITDGTELVEAYTRMEYEEYEAKLVAAMKAKDAALAPQPPRVEEDCPDMTGATSGSCVKKKGRVVFSVVSRPHRRVRRETVVVVCPSGPHPPTRPRWADAIMYSPTPRWADPIMRSGSVYYSGCGEVLPCSRHLSFQ